ncbi:MAG: hypothetical protein ACXADY_16755 [Candidatus Hodarchaeales archaeon]|jgi:uncharacterized protein with ATP-grasp and redox domains
MSKEELIKKFLVVDETKILEENLKLASELIFLTNNGEILFKINEDELSIKERILLYMLGKKYAFEAKLVDEENIGLDELSKQLRVGKESMAARIADLRNERKIKNVKRGEYALQIYDDIKKFLMCILKKFDKTKKR